MARDLSDSTSNSLKSAGSNCSGLTTGSSSDASYTEPFTPSNGFSEYRSDAEVAADETAGNHCGSLKVASGGLLTNTSNRPNPPHVSFAEVELGRTEVKTTSSKCFQPPLVTVKKSIRDDLSDRHEFHPRCIHSSATNNPNHITTPEIHKLRAIKDLDANKILGEQLSLKHPTEFTKKMYDEISPGPFSHLEHTKRNIRNPGNAKLPSQTAGPQQIFPSSRHNLIHEHESQDLPVGELFRTLQIWFDQEGFREIAPIFIFSYYNREEDLLYFTTERVGYPFHYDPMQQVPILRKIVAPDYEEAYALLEGKTHRNVAGRRDFISRQASLHMKTAGKYKVEDTEGKGGKWIWRLVYEVEERKSLMGRPMAGERAFIPITFACSPEVLDPTHARKPTILNAIIKNIGSKKAAVPLDEHGRPVTRPRGKSLIGYHSRKRSDSKTRLLNTPPRINPKANPVAYETTPSPPSTKTSTGTSSGGDELSFAQSHFFKTISPASASPLRPATSQLDESSKKSVRKVKTSEHLRRPFTADPSGGCSAPPIPSLPAHLPNITPVFGIAPQPSRATPNTLAKRFQSRPKTTEDRRPVTDRRLLTAKSQLDIKRIAAASFFTPPGLST